MKEIVVRFGGIIGLRGQEYQNEKRLSDVPSDPAQDPACSDAEPAFEMLPECRNCVRPATLHGCCNELASSDPCVKILLPLRLNHGRCTCLTSWHHTEHKLHQEGA
jgi:hypothetical protein